MDLEQFPMGAFEVDCDGSSCGSSRLAGAHVHPAQVGHTAIGVRVTVRDGQRVGYEPVAAAGSGGEEGP